MKRGEIKSDTYDRQMEGYSNSLWRCILQMTDKKQETETEHQIYTECLHGKKSPYGEEDELQITFSYMELNK